MSTVRRSYVYSQFVDFWLLGGLSIFVCLFMHMANHFKSDVEIINLRFVQMGALFSVLSLFFNYPHFMMSYRFGYSRGYKFIRHYWFSLLVLPLTLLSIFLLAYFFYNSDLLGTRYGESALNYTILLMYLTVGWHYSKQIYGCMMVYAFYDEYPLGKWQKLIIRWSTLSVGIYQFAYVANTFARKPKEQYSQGFNIQSQFSMPFLLPPWLESLAILLMILLGGLTLISFGLIYKRHKRFPSINFLVPWMSFYIWWIPFGDLPEYYILMVPFFHSIQYLLFAYRIEHQELAENFKNNSKFFIRVLLVLAAGFLFFEFIPDILDKNLETNVYQTRWFFVTVFATFLNVHHFFIDSVIWKFKDKEIKSKLLYLPAQ